MEEGMNLMQETAADSAAADFRYICSLSTILVATIQELKDRVSQIELIFCSQLFPKIQSSCGGGGRRRQEELEWRGKESELLRQIEELRGSLVKEREERERLGREVESRDRSLSAEQSKRREAAREFGTLKERYNSLKSQYTYLLGKLEGNSGNLKGSERVAEEEEEKARDHSSKRSHEDIDETHTKEISPCNDHRKPKFNLSSLSPSTRTTPSCTADFEEFGTKKISPHSEPRKQKLNLISLSTSTRPPKNCISVKEENLSWCQTNKISTSPRLFPKPPSGKTTETSVGQKRPTTWRDTRAHQKPGGANPDPHDDFLDTPIEMARASRPDKSSTSPACSPVPQELCRDKLPVEEPTAFQVPAPQDMDFNNSDEETQDLTSNKISIQSKENNFKFIEPVRKKAERESLKGIECKQCKKFYDAVLPGNGEGKGSDGIGNSLRCEHHEGVSRHRYRYAPPLTPEGFWNIGFESEM